MPPISGLAFANLQDTFEEVHNGHRHEAIDILEPRGDPVASSLSRSFLSRSFSSLPVSARWVEHI
jgi:hypothetical protein